MAGFGGMLLYGKLRLPFCFSYAGTRRVLLNCLQKAKEFFMIHNMSAVLPSPKMVSRLRAEYPEGSRVSLVFMDDTQAPPIGTLGTVVCVDITGTVQVDWDNGSTLGVVAGVDAIKKERGAV